MSSYSTSKIDEPVKIRMGTGIEAFKPEIIPDVFLFFNLEIKKYI